MVLGAIVVSVTIFYSVRHFRNEDPTVYINNLVLSGPPKLSLNNSNFLLMLKHLYPESGLYFGQQEKFFTV